MATTTPNPDSYDTPVLVIGGGPVGLLTAYELARLGIPCILAEQSLDTTKWPKMDLTNCRSMEILRMWGLADEFRGQDGAVGEEYRFDSIFYTTMAEGGETLTSWRLPSVKEWRKSIAEHNDGSQPAEPGQRCSQIVFERWMKQKCLQQSTIDARFGLKFLSFTEDENGVTSVLEDRSGRKKSIKSKYLVGCDGGGSAVRRGAAISMIGGPLPITLYLVHFRSKQLASLRPYGRFWHAFGPDGGFMIDQDEGDTFTVHQVIDPHADVSKIDPYEIIYSILGGSHTPFRIQVDEILVSSAWRPNFCIVDDYMSKGGRVFLAGDSAHRNPPHGGYGMNTGVEDALALSWRLASVIQGYGGPQLLSSYTTEQQPIMVRRLKRSQRHVLEHIPRVAIATEVPGLLHEHSPAGKELRRKLTAYIDESGSECLDRGIELDSRYDSSVIYQDTDGSPEPEWHLKRYTPSTRPGSRAPHVFLNAGDGTTSILDLYGREWTLVSFCEYDIFEVNADSTSLAAIARSRNIPLQLVHLSKIAEPLARQLWERDFVLVRADGHVAWRGNEMPSGAAATEIWDVVLGWKPCPGYVEPAEPDVGFMLEMTAKSKTDEEGKNGVEEGIRNGELAFE